MAEIATGNRDDALDIVQEAMMALVKNYSERNPQEWGPLFHRILQTKIRDWYRRRNVKRKFMDWFGVPKHQQDEESVDLIQNAVDIHGKDPLQELQQRTATEALIVALRHLPRRQQQAFMLRAWEGLSVAETSRAMSCSDSSVKTHYSRALSVLRVKLEAVW